MSDTPKTDAFIGDEIDDNITEGEIAAWEFARKLERHLNNSRKWSSALADAADDLRSERNDLRDMLSEAIAQRDQLQDAVRDYRDAKGRFHTEKACKRLLSLLPENETCSQIQ